MTIKYIYKNKRPVAKVWTPKIVKDKMGTAVVTGAVIATGIAVAYVLWKTSSMQQRTALSTCHTCGQR